MPLNFCLPQFQPIYILFGIKRPGVLKEVTVVAMIAVHVNIISHGVPLINSGLLNNRAAHSPIK